MTLEQRIDRLERSAARWRLAAFALAILILAGAGAATQRSKIEAGAVDCDSLFVHGPIIAESLRITANGGRTHLDLLTDDQSAQLSMDSADGGHVDLAAVNDGDLLALTGAKDFPHKLVCGVSKATAGMTCSTLEKCTTYFGTDSSGGQLEAYEMDGTGYAMRGKGVGAVTPKGAVK